MKPRNLYKVSLAASGDLTVKFVRVEGWKLEQAVRTHEAM
jgi:hypothetical protein